MLQLLFVGGSAGLSMLATYLLGYLLGLTMMVAILVGFNLYIRKRRVEVLKFFGVKDAGIDSSSNTKIRYICLSCGTKVFGRTCKKCGSHMKKVVF